MKEIFFRQLTAKDCSKYIKLRLNFLKQYPDNFGTTYPEELNTEPLKLSNAIQRADQRNFVFGAFTASRRLIGICGFMAGLPLKTRHRGEIVQLCVDPACHGNGIGKTLLQLCTDKAFNSQQIEQIILSVVYRNHNAVKLYKQHGFIEYGKLEHYFKFDDDKYFTQLFLYLAKQPGF